VGKLLDLSKDLPISQENQKLLNEASNDDLEQQVAALNETPNELEQQVAALNEAPNELEQQVAALSSESEDESPVVKSTRRFPKRTPFYSGRRSLKSRRGRTSFSPKFIENYESSHPNYISPENMDTYRKYMLKVRPYNIGSVQNRSVNLNPTLNEERADTLLAKKLSKSPSPRSPSPRSPSPRLPSPRPPSPRSPSPRSPSPRPPSPIPVQLTPEQRYLAQKLSNARHVLRSAMSRSKVDGKGYLVEEEALLAAYIKFELSRMK
jgi:hypothetical protein